MHVDAERGRRCVVAEPSLQAGGLGQSMALAAQFLGNIEGEVTGLPEHVEILLEKTVLAIVERDPIGEALQHFVRKNVVLDHGVHDASPLLVGLTPI